MPEQFIALSNAVMTSRHTSSDWLKMIQRSFWPFFDAVPVAMQAYLYAMYGQRLLNKSFYWCHIWTESSARADSCKPTWVRHYTHSFNVDTVDTKRLNESCRWGRTMTVMGALGTRRHTIRRCHVALHSRPSSSFDCQRCRNAV